MFDKNILNAIACTNGLDIHEVRMPEYINEYIDEPLFTEDELKELETFYYE